MNVRFFFAFVLLAFASLCASKFAKAAAMGGYGYDVVLYWNSPTSFGVSAVGGDTDYFDDFPSAVDWAQSWAIATAEPAWGAVDGPTGAMDSSDGWGY